MPFPSPRLIALPLGVNVSDNVEAGVILNNPYTPTKIPNPLRSEDRRQARLLSHFAEEEYLMPFWIRHHAHMFDSAVLVDFEAADSTRKTIEEIAPTSWKVIDSGVDVSLFDGGSKTEATSRPSGRLTCRRTRKNEETMTTPTRPPLPTWRTSAGCATGERLCRKSVGCERDVPRSARRRTGELPPDTEHVMSRSAGGHGLVNEQVFGEKKKATACPCKCQIHMRPHVQTQVWDFLFPSWTVQTLHSLPYRFD